MDYPPPAAVAAGVVYGGGAWTGTLSLGAIVGAASLAIVDNLDGTATITVSGAGISGDVVVYVSPLTVRGAGVVVAAGTRTGAGPVTVTLASGAYLAWAVADSGETSSGDIFRVSDRTEALHYRCLVAAREYVMRLALPGMFTDPAKHRVVKLPYRPGVEFTGGEGVFYFPKAESYSTEDNIRDGIIYPVQVVWLRANAKELSEGLPELLKQRELMFRAFTALDLVDVCEVHSIRVRPGAVILPEAWKNSYDASSVLFEMFTQQAARSA